MCEGTGQAAILPAFPGISLCLCLLLRQDSLSGITENLGIVPPLCPQGLGGHGVYEESCLWLGASAPLDTWCSEVTVGH